MNKACPIILRKIRDELEILAFEHPLAGNQLVKGSIEKDELLADACIRELAEESGLAARPHSFLGVWNANFDNQEWGFYVMEYDGVLPDSWVFHTADDGGHIFKFFWQPLNQHLDGNWHLLFGGAVDFIRQALIANKFIVR